MFVRPLNKDVGTKLAGRKALGGCSGRQTASGLRSSPTARSRRLSRRAARANICDTPDLLGGTWNADGVIVFASSKGLQRVLAAGGEPSPIAAAAGSEAQRPHEPYFLPDARHYLYLAGGAGGAGTAGSDAAIYAGSLDSTNATRIVAAQSNAVYAEPGYLLYHRDGTLCTGV